MSELRRNTCTPRPRRMWSSLTRCAHRYRIRR